MANTRVHILAKELGVKSKAIIEKCEAEGLDIKNHMSTISVGLAATISEWFSEGEHSTTVETAARVDLKKVRVKKRKLKKEVEPELSSESVEKESSETQAESFPEAGVEAVAELAIEESEAVESEAPSAEVTIEKEPKSKEEVPVKHRPVMNVPRKLESVTPAGPKLGKPKPANLSGPKVIRVEKAEPIKPRGPKARPTRFSAPGVMTESLNLPEKLQTPVKGVKPGRGAKKKKRGKGEVVEEAAKPYRSHKVRGDKDIEERRARLAAAQGDSVRFRPVRRLETSKKGEPSHERPSKAIVTEPITVKGLSAALAVKSTDIIAKLMSQGIMANVNQAISRDVAELIAIDFGTELIVEQKESIDDEIRKEFDQRERKNLVRRPVVVTMLGHVDHGKTSLLDRIRSSNVAGGEAGGITQHIGAYQVNLEGKKVTFLDTPGHEAFTAMRARGANMTDVAVLVVAADDGLMPQTIEAIHHAKAARVSIIVALNKIDIPGVDVNRIYGQLAEHELTPAEWGGDTEVVKTSAITGEGIHDLIEHLDIIADLLELKADNTIPARGFVVESKMSTTQGVVATLLVKEGVLKKGDVILAGEGYGRVRTMKDYYGKSVSKAESSMPVEVSGLSEVPQAGDRFYCLEDINRAKQAAEDARVRSRENTLAKRSQVTLENLFSQIEAGSVKELNLIVRADVQGSVDVLLKYLTDISTDEVKVRILHSGVGGITEGDVVLAEASEAIIIGFNVVADDYSSRLAEEKGIDIRLYNIIYRITEDLRDAMTGLLEPVEEERRLGRLTVRDTFKVSGVGTIAGCFVNEGVVTRNAKIKLIRNNIVIKDGCQIESLKHFKDDAREVKSGFECGIKIGGYDDVKIDDMFEAYEIIKVAKKL